MRFESPAALALLLAVPLLLWLRGRTAHRGAIRFSDVRAAERAGHSLRVRLRRLPTLLRVLAIVCLVLALARPQAGQEIVRDTSEGIAIAMVVDRSGSMGNEMTYQGRRTNRLDVVKQVFREFVLGNGRDLPGRSDDLIGMIAFARYPDTVCPLTLAHDTLPVFLDNLQLVRYKPEDGTAIGDALAVAAARLQTAGETVARQRESGRESYAIKSRVIILLSDGENNAGRRDPLQAADLAARWGIRVYAIGIGGGESAGAVQTPFGVFQVPVPRRADSRVLEEVARRTGGFFRRARDAESLREIYAEIDRMERTEVQSVRRVDYREAFAGLAIAALLLTLAEVLLRCTLFRRIP